VQKGGWASRKPGGKRVNLATKKKSLAAKEEGQDTYSYWERRTEPEERAVNLLKGGMRMRKYKKLQREEIHWDLEGEID